MVVVNLMKIILVYHLLQVLLHPLFAQVVRWVSALVVGDYMRVLQTHVSQLIPQSQPAWHAVVRSAKKLDLLATWQHTLDDTVDLIRLATGLTNFADNHIAIETSIDEGVTLYSN